MKMRGIYVNERKQKPLVSQSQLHQKKKLKMNYNCSMCHTVYCPVAALATLMFSLFVVLTSYYKS